MAFYGPQLLGWSERPSCIRPSRGFLRAAQEIMQLGNLKECRRKLSDALCPAQKLEAAFKTHPMRFCERLTEMLCMPGYARQISQIL